MANSFTNDNRLAAQYRFESGALITDSKGGNTLTAYNSPGESTGDYKEGTCAVDLNGSSQYFKRLDADLDAGFPMKSGDTLKKFTVSVWFKLDSVTGDHHIIGKWTLQGNQRSWLLFTNTNILKLSCSGDGGSSFVSTVTLATGLVTGRWYHVNVAVDCPKLRSRSVVYDATANTEVLTRGSMNYAGYCSTAPLAIGCSFDASGNPTTYFDGLLDEALIFKGLLSYDEMSRIRRATYPAEGLVARWQFESSPGFLLDSQGDNDLTNVNSVSQDASVYYEGAASAGFVAGSSQMLQITDANLDAGFPFKSGGAHPQLFTAFMFCRPSSPGSNATFFGKYSSSDNKRCWRFGKVGGYYRVYLGYSSGTNYQNTTLYDFPAINNEWVAIAISFDHLANLVTTRMLRFSTGLLYRWTWTPIQVSSVTDADFTIGGDGDGYYFNGNIDDVRMFDRMVSDFEFSRLAKQLYDGLNNRQSVINLGLVVAYKEPLPGQFTYEGNITVTALPGADYDPFWTKTGAITATALPTSGYTFQGPNEFIYVGANIPVSVTPSAVTFNVRHYTGNIPASVLPTSTYFNCVFKFLGNIEIEITPTSGYRIPVIGWDIPSGYGCVDFSALADPPPYWCIETDGITLALDNTAVKLELYAEYAMETEGGAVVGGAGEFEIVEPGVFSVDLSGGVRIAFGLDFEIPEPWITVLETSGGLLVGGSLEPVLYTPPEWVLIKEITTSGGVVIGGACEFSFFEALELITTFTLSGGVVVGGYRYPPIEFVDADPDEIYYAVDLRGTVYVGGELDIDIPEPCIYEWTIRRGGVLVSGDCTFGFWQPPLTEFDLLGGVFVEGSIIEDDSIFEAWVLTGQGFQPSMYSRFGFNSFTSRNGQVLAAKDDGIYVLEGDDDDGQTIRPGVRIGPTNFGVDNFKGIRAIYPGDSGTPTARVAGHTKGQEAFCDLDRGRFSVGHEILDRVLVVDISDFEQLSHLEIIPRVRTKGHG